jgi:hypothetical protein
MSRPPRYENGAYGADSAAGAADPYDVHGADPAVGEPAGPPNVYVPPTVPPPEYDGYADPAAAHGWQNAYDPTQELPRVTDGEGGRTAGDQDRAAADRPRHGTGRRSRRRPSPWRSRRVAVAAGAVGALSVAALIAGFAVSGSSSGGKQGTDDGTSPTAGKPATTSTATDPASSPGTAATGRPSGSGASGAPSAGASASPSASTSGSGSDTGAKDPATKSPTTTPTSSTPVDSAPGNSDRKPGRGLGGTKGPK